MDEQHLHTLRQNILMALRKAEASLLSGHQVDFSLVEDHLNVFQAYLTRHMPEHPSTELKELVYDILHHIEGVAETISQEIQLSKQRIADLTVSSKVTHAYMNRGYK